MKEDYIGKKTRGHTRQQKIQGDTERYKRTRKMREQEGEVETEG